MELMTYPRARHSVTKLIVHLVFTVKYRRKLFNGDMLGQIRYWLGWSCNRLGCTLLEIW